MNHLDEWVHLIAKQLKSEAELIGVQAKSELYEDAARDTFVRMVLEPFLPASYAVGSGKIIDAAGNISQPQDIVIYRSDYPQFNMPGSHDVFIYESVLATIQVRSKLVRKTFFSAMDQCASLGTLNPAIDLTTRRAIAEKMKMQADPKYQYIHPDPLHTGRFNLIARPHCFIYAFTGYQTSEHQLAENLNKWIDVYHQNHDALQMKSLPSVIATQGCFAWRNTAPFTIKKRTLMGVGNDPAPLRLIMLQLMHALNRRLQNTSDGYGIKSTIAPYLAHFDAPRITEMVGTALNPGDKKPAPSVGSIPKQLADENKTTPAHKTPIAQPGREAISAAQTAGVDEKNPSPGKSQPPAGNATAVVGGERTGGTALPDRGVQKPKQAAIQPEATEQPQQISPIPKSVNPLSTFKNVDEKEEVEEYKFEPIDPARPEPETVEKPAKSDDSVLRSAAIIDDTQSGHDHNKANEDLEKTQKLPEKLVSQEKDDASKDPLMDTLIEAPEDMQKIKSEATAKKSEYVTETLI